MVGMMYRADGTELLAEVVLARRKHLRLRQGDVDRRGGASVAVLRRIEQGRRANLQRRTLRGLDRALEWPPGAAKAVFAASEPPFPGSPVTDLRAYAEELVSGEFWSVGGLVLDHAEGVHALPTRVLVARVAPLAVELARRFNVDPADPTAPAGSAQDGQNDSDTGTGR